MDGGIADIGTTASVSEDVGFQQNRDTGPTKTATTAIRRWNINSYELFSHTFEDFDQGGRPTQTIYFYV